MGPDWRLLSKPISWRGTRVFVSAALVSPVLGLLISGVVYLLLILLVPVRAAPLLFCISAGVGLLASASLFSYLCRELTLDPLSTLTGQPVRAAILGIKLGIAAGLIYRSIAVGCCLAIGFAILGFGFESFSTSIRRRSITSETPARKI
jgi:hypothetical protein